MNAHIQALRHHLEVCEQARLLILEERRFIESEASPIAGAPPLTARREALGQALQASLQKLRELDAAPGEETAMERGERANLVAAAREATRHVLEQQSRLETLMLHHSLRRPRCRATDDPMNPRLAARRYASPESIQTEKPFDSGPG